MRRGSDRFAGWLSACVLLAFAVGAPLAADRAARAMYRHDVRDERETQRDVTQVESVLLDDAVEPYTAQGVVPADVTMARARWTGPDGLPRVGVVQVPPDKKVGGRVQIWIDEHGAPASPPTRRNLRADAVASATAAVLGVMAVLGVLSWAARRLLNRHRLRTWQHEWLEVGPRWTRHR